MKQLFSTYFQPGIGLEPNSRILIVDDNEAIQSDFQKIFGGSSEDEDFDAEAAEMLGQSKAESSRTKFELTFASQGAEALEIVKDAMANGRPFAMAFMDVRMPPGWDGIETTLKLWEVDPDIQIVICTAYSDYSWDEMKEMIPYPERLLILKKPFDSIEVLQFAHSLTEKWSLIQAARKNTDELNRTVNERTWELRSAVASLEAEIAARKATEERVRKQARLLEKGRDAIVIRDMRDTIISWNHRAEELYGWSAEEAVGKKVDTLLNENELDLQAVEARCMALEDGYWRGTLRRKRRDGAIVDVECFWTLVRHETGIPREIVEINSDLNERAGIEADAVRGERLESIGSFAAVVAHDLNNLLSPMLFGTSLLADRHPDGKEKKWIDAIETSVHRGLDLVKQIVHFAKGVQLKLETLAPAKVLADFETLFRPGLSSTIDLEIDMPADDLRFRADPVQFGQVLLNLCVNARDAMPDGGTLRITTRTMEIGHTYASTVWGLDPGSYLRIDVADSGVGIPPEVKDKIFEPFFTTKSGNGGTGLGLSTVFSIMKNHRGAVTVDSQPGQGTTFHLYLPLLKPGATGDLRDVQMPFKSSQREAFALPAAQ